MNGLRVLLSMGTIWALFLAPFSPPLQSDQAEAAAAAYYVSPGGNALHACTLDDPCNIDHAIEHAVGGDTIYLYEGTYTDYAGFNIVDLGEDINLYGGLYGHIHTPYFTRLLIDPADHPSILDGELYRRGIYIHNGVTPIIDGIKFINGSGNPGDNVLCGGAQLHAQGCGAGIFIDHAAPTIQNCVFYENRAVRLNMPEGLMGYGGGIFVESPTIGQVLIQHNIFENNRATDVNDGDGSAIAIHGTDATGIVTIWDNLFKDNVATNMGGAIAAEFFHGTLLLIQDNRFEANKATHAGAGIYLNFVDHAIILHNWFSGQVGQIGFYDNGMVDAGSSGLSFSSNTLIDNEPDYGLKIFDPLTPPKVINNLIVRSGRLASIQLLGWGGAAGTDMHTANLKHNTLVGSGVADSLAVKVTSVGCTVGNCAEALIDNTILFKFGTGFSAPDTEAGKITADYTMFYQVTTATDGYVINHNQVNQPYAGFKDYLKDDYHLVRNAPARDKGKDAGVTVDFEGDPRPLGGGYDLGYDEFALHTLLPLVVR